MWSIWKELKEKNWSHQQVYVTSRRVRCFMYVEQISIDHRMGAIKMRPLVDMDRERKKKRSITLVYQFKVTCAANRTTAILSTYRSSWLNLQIVRMPKGKPYTLMPSRSPDFSLFSSHVPSRILIMYWWMGWRKSFRNKYPPFLSSSSSVRGDAVMRRMIYQLRNFY